MPNSSTESAPRPVTDPPTTTPVEEMGPEELVQALLARPAPSDPYLIYSRLRELAPRYRSDMGMRFLSRYDDVSECLRNPTVHMLADSVAKTDPRFTDSVYLQAIPDMLIFTNPPKHPRIRRLLARAFTPRMVDRLRPRIRDLVDERIDVIAAKGHADLIADLAGIIPNQVICEMIGVPEEDREQIRAWVEIISNTVQPVIPDDTLAIANEAIVDYHAYLTDLANARRRSSRDDLISALVEAEDRDQKLNTAELGGFLVTVLGAGTETTTNLISIGTMALLQNPDQLALLRDNPALMGNAIEELLRFEPPIQMAFPRLTTEATTLGGDTIAAGELLGLLLGAANHDPAVFPEPTALRIDRPQTAPHITFGAGPHFCMGAAIARIEGATALTRLLIERFPRMELVGQALDWRQAFTLRGVKELWINTN